MKFKLFWKTGKTEIVEGKTIEEAFGSQYSAGAITALDFYSGTPEDWDDYQFNPEKREWYWTEAKRASMGLR